jgi:hypothetical protein
MFLFLRKLKCNYTVIFFGFTDGPSELTLSPKPGKRYFACQGVVIPDKGHILTSHPREIIQAAYG